MARRQADLQIFWVVVLAAIFWIAIWQHERVSAWYHKAATSVWMNKLRGVL